MQISEKVLLVGTTITTAISALFCIISLATPRWTSLYGLYCSGCSVPASGLAIVAFIILVLAVGFFGLFICRILPNSTRILGLGILFLGVIFTLATFASFSQDSAGYSYKLMVVSNFFCVVAAMMAAFWLGGSYAASMTRST